MPGSYLHARIFDHPDGVHAIGSQRLLPRWLVHVEWFVVMELLTTTPRPMPAGGDVRWATADDDALLASLGGDPAEVLASSGVERLLSAIDRLNTASLRSARRRGGRAIGSVAMVRILGVSLRREDWFAEVRYRVHRGRRDLVPPPAETARRRPVPVGRG